jgi:cob(I)alamin adenosyltransferase
MKKYYSRTGDDGYTGLLGKGRVPKYHPRPEVTGLIDETTAAIGMARAISQSDITGPLLLKVQRDLYNMMAEISTTPENAAQFRVIDEERVSWLEKQIDYVGSITEIPDGFIVPGDSQAGATMSLARTIVRRSERSLAKLLHDNQIENVELLRYLNRLSSLCFVLENLENQVSGKNSHTLAKTNE